MVRGCSRAAGVRSPGGTGSDKAACGLEGTLAEGGGLRPILALLPTRQVVLGKCPRPSVGLFPGQHSQ